MIVIRARSWFDRLTTSGQRVGNCRDIAHPEPFDSPLILSSKDEPFAQDRLVEG